MAARSRVLAGRLVRLGVLADGWLEIRGDRLTHVEHGRTPRGAERLPGIVAPGLCDLQVNGAAGVDVTDRPDALDAIDAVQLDHGVTSYLPTVVTAPEETARAAVAEISARVADPASPVEGVHLEGPFLAPAFRGVHPRENLAVPSSHRPRYYDAAAVRLVTLAPELPGALAFIAELARRGTAVSLGHTGASPETAARAVAAGASAVTHLFNGMTRFHHRRPGVAGWALAAARVRLSVVADGFHVDPLVLRLVDRVARGRVVLVSDSSPAAAAGPGDYRLAGVAIRSDGDRVSDENGRLAGSALTLDEAARRWSRFTGRPLAEALVAASERPARLAGIPSGLRPGAPADLVVLDENGSIRRVMRRGAWVR